MSISTLYTCLNMLFIHGEICPLCMSIYNLYICLYILYIYICSLYMSRTTPNLRVTVNMTVVTDMAQNHHHSRRSGGRALACISWDHLIESGWWVHLQFGLFSVPTSGPQLVYQRLWCVLSCLWESASKRSLAAYRKE